MSLQLAAQHMASRGRGPDTTLVHMAPQEVAGLQALAKAHGGSLTTNPDTGLPEAGFLSSILPMVAGAALAATGVGAPMAAMMVGGGMTVATGSLQKGLMAGLGAYGGAGLAGGLMGAGAAGATGAGMAGAGANALGTVAPEAVAANLGVQGAATGAGSQAAMLAEQTAGFGSQGLSALQNAAAIPGTSLVAPQNVVQSIANQVPTSTAMPQLTEQGVLNQAAADATNAYQSGSIFDRLGAGAKEVMKDPSRFMTKENLKYGLAGLAPVAMDMLTPKQRAEEEKRKAYEYSYAPGRVEDPQAGYTGAYTGERAYFNPVYTRTAAGGGLMDIGPVESMSRSNQSQMAPAYAQGGVSDMAVNPYTGAEMFAEGGETKAVKPVEQDPYYTMSGQSGDAFKYLMGQMPAASKAPAPAAPTGMSGFLGNITGFASPEGIQKTDGTFTPWSASNPKPTGSFFGGPETPVTPSLGARLGSPFRAAASVINPGAGGYYEDDTSGLIKPYSFDPNTGLFTAAPAPKRFVPYETDVATTIPGLSYENMNGGMANGGIASLAQGGQSHLGDYSDGGRLLRGPGDGVSDDIPASIGDKRPARLADGEFVVPARIVSELGNGSTEAGARKLYAMMDRVQKARKKSIGKDRVAVNSRAEKLLPV
jgi:hypothetical protein